MTRRPKCLCRSIPRRTARRSTRSGESTGSTTTGHASRRYSKDTTQKEDTQSTPTCNKLRLRIHMCDSTFETRTEGDRRTNESVSELPPRPVEIKPHPRGVELGQLIQMLHHTKCRTLRQFLEHEFSRVGHKTALAIIDRAGSKLSERSGRNGLPTPRPMRCIARSVESTFRLPAPIAWCRSDRIDYVRGSFARCRRGLLRR